MAEQNSELEPRGEEIETAREELRQLLEVVPSERNFDIDISSEGENNDRKIILRHRDGRSISINSFLPHGFKIREGESFDCNYPTRTITYPPQKKEYNTFLLSLLHEIGHARQGRRRDLALIVPFIKSIPDILRQYNKYAKRDEGKPKGERTVNKLPVEVFLPVTLLERAEIPVVRGERNSWTFALRQLRALNRQGFDVFSGFDDARMIQTFIDFNLASYECSFRLRLASAGKTVSGMKPKNLSGNTPR